MAPSCEPSNIPCAAKPVQSHVVKLETKYQKFFDKLAALYSTAIRLILNALLLITVLALFVGISKSGIDLYYSLKRPLEEVLQNMLLDVVFIVALLEVTITILSYLKEGQVHVRYIVDTVLVIMLNEVVSMWFTKPKLEYALGLSIVIATLAAVRITVTRYAPVADKESA